MKKKLLLNCFFVLILAATGWTQSAQTKTLSGKITDAISKAPLIGASVTVPGTNFGTTTDSSGQFSLQVPADTKSLEVSNVDYQTQLIDVSGATTFSIQLSMNSGGMNEVVVVGYGTQKKKDLTGSVSTVSGRDVAGRQTVQVSEALQGAMAGVTVTRGSSAPGAGATIRIRGITTTGNSNPLFLVDGVPVSSIDNVNPNDIESISVLKDAASAAIYGSRGAAGVVLVTTKRGRTNQSDLEYNYEYGLQKPTALPQFVGIQDYMRYFNEQVTNDGAATGPYPTALIDTYLDSNRVDPDRFPNTDWQDLTMQRKYAPRQRHDLVFTVGTGKLKTKASIGYQKAGAFYDNYDYERMLMRLNNDLQINERLTINLDVAYKRTLVNNVIPTPGGSSPIYEGRVLPPIYDAYYDDGRFAPGKDGRNPVAQIYQGGFAKDNFHQLMARLAVNFKPFKDLTITALISPTVDFDKTKSYSQQIRFTDKEDASRVLFTNLRSTTFLSESRNESLAMNGQVLINYDKQIGTKHNVSALAGYEEIYNRFESIGASRDGFALTGFPYLSVGSQEFRDNSGGASESALRSFFGRLSYNFDEKYYIQGNIRSDNSSRFGKDFRNALFPSLSAGWVISQESFLENLSWLSFLKIRASIGVVGNERIGNYPYQASLDASTGLFYQGTNVVPLNGYAQTGFVVPDITWETTRTTDIGVDLAFLNNRLSITADYFERRTRDILLTRDIPNYVGFNDPVDNLGILSAKGWELEMGWRDRVGKLNYSISANVSDAKTQMIEFSNTGALGNIVNVVGQEYNSWYGYRYLGIFQDAAEVSGSPAFPNTKPGDIKYLDLNKDGKISSDGDREILGGSLPRYQYGGNIRLDYKGLDFGFVFQGVGKKLSLLPSEATQPFAEAFGNMPASMVGRFWSKTNTPEQNQAAFFPRLSRASSTINYQVSDHYLISGAYFRVKNITLGYTLQTGLKKAGIKSIRLYVSANDLLTIDQYPDYIDADPEVSNYGYPIVKTFLMGASIRF